MPVKLESLRPWARLGVEWIEQAHLEVHFSHDQKAAHLFNFAFGHMMLQDTACWMQQYVKGWPYISLNQSRRKCSFFHVQQRDSNSFFCSVAVYFTSFQVWFLLWVCGWAREREEKVGKVQNKWMSRAPYGIKGGWTAVWSRETGGGRGSRLPRWGCFAPERPVN